MVTWNSPIKSYPTKESIGINISLGTDLVTLISCGFMKLGFGYHYPARIAEFNLFT